jgi:TolB-like protein/Tfp pilus assembly protein PilF
LTDVFLSYGHDDAATARRFAEALEREGFTVWWDAALRSGDAFDAAIEAALKRAKAIIVLWSKSSVESRWVRAEATLAQKRGSLVPVMIGPCDLPIMFQLTHTVDLGHWHGAPEDLAWRALLADVRRFVEARSHQVEPPAAGHASAAVEPVPSIAVLPFANMSGDKEQEYFSDGLAEEIINALANISGLRVIARTSAFAFKGQNTDIRDIARTLGVAHLLEGSVRRSGNRIRVTAQLITASNGSHMWSERFDRELTDIFTVQDEISAAIAAALKVRLSAPAAGKPRYTPKLPAYEALLKARHFHWKITVDATNQAKLFYEQAIALDPQFALAHADYADYLFGRTTLGLSSMREVAPIIRGLAQRAVELDSSLADAHEPLGLLAATYDYDWNEAGRQFALAAPEGAGSPQCHFAGGYFYALAVGRREEAVKQLELAVKGDPLHLMRRCGLAACLGAVGRYAEADEILHQCKELDPHFIVNELYLAILYMSRQMFAEALPFAERTASQVPWYLPSIGLHAGLLVRTGQPARAEEVLQALGSGEAYHAALSLALFHTCCGELDLAANWFEKAIAQRDAEVVVFLQGVIGEPIRASKHWLRLAALMNLPEATPTTGVDLQSRTFGR